MPDPGVIKDSADNADVAEALKRLKKMLGARYVDAGTTRQQLDANFSYAATLADTTGAPSGWDDFVAWSKGRGSAKSPVGRMGRAADRGSSKEFTAGYNAYQKALSARSNPKPKAATKTKTTAKSSSSTGVVQDTSAQLREQARPASTSTSNVAGLPGGTLRRGDQGDDVKALQRVLNANGANLTENGKFGPATETALKNYQGRAGIGKDGVYGSETRGALGGTTPTSSGGSSSGGGGGGGGGGSRSSGGGSTGGSTSGSTGGGQSQNLPGGYQVWNINGVPHLIYTVPGSNTPMAWKVTDNLQDVIGSTKVDKNLTSKDAAKAGVLVMGRYSDLKNTEKHPFDSFLDTINERATIEPWLKDPEVLAQAAEAYLEGRPISLTDLRETTWYNSRTDKERDWIKRAAEAAPAELKSMRKDSEDLMRRTLLDAGVSDPPAQLVRFLVEKDLTGAWSDVQVTQQITAVADPYSGVTMDSSLKAAMKGLDLVTRADDVRAMKQRVKDWIGPFANSYTDKQLQEWAGMLRNDPNGEMKLDDILRGQRMALLPEYDNPDVQWRDVSAPWKSWLENSWGEEVADDDDVLLKVVRANDVNEAGRIALSEGMKRGVGGATDKVTSAMSQAFGNGTRGSL